MHEKIVTLSVSDRVKGLGLHVKKAAEGVVGALIASGVIRESDPVTVRVVKKEGVRRGSVGSQVEVTHVEKDADGNVDARNETYRIG